MNKESIRKLSVLGVVLMAASAVTAAIMPKDETDKTAAGNNRLVPSTGGNGNQLTCVATISPVNQCTVTAGTLTTVAGQTSLTANGVDKTFIGGTTQVQNSSQSPS